MKINRAKKLVDAAFVIAGDAKSTKTVSLK